MLRFFLIFCAWRRLIWIKLYAPQGATVLLPDTPTTTPPVTIFDLNTPNALETINNLKLIHFFQSSFQTRSRNTSDAQRNANSDRHLNAPRADRERNEQAAPLSSDPDLTFEVRIIYRIITAQHHLRNVSQDQPPAMIYKMTNTLSVFIKPAIPTETTFNLITGNAKNWSSTTILIHNDQGTATVFSQSHQSQSPVHHSVLHTCSPLPVTTPGYNQSFRGCKTQTFL